MRSAKGTKRTPIKAALIHGCEGRRCLKCNRLVVVPIESNWTTCTPCRNGWTNI